MIKFGDARMRADKAPEDSRMSVIGIIPARGGSKGFPGKNIHKLLGKPMMAYVIEAAQAAETIDRVIVSTDDETYAAVAREFGAEVIMRPPEISGDTAPIQASLVHVINTIEAQGEQVEIVVLMQANVPVRKPGLIDEVVTKLRNSSHDSVTTMYKANQRPEWMKVLQDGKPVPFMECNSYRRQELPKVFLFDGAVNAIRRDVLMKSAELGGVHKFGGDDVGIIMQERIYSLDLDGENDLPMVEAALEYLAKRGGKLG